MRVLILFCLGALCLDANAMEFDSDAILPFRCDYSPGQLWSMFREIGYWWRG